MALTSLKKTAPRAKRPKVNIDEFIDDANRYAMGQAQIVPINKFVQGLHAHEPLRRATFTLGEEGIDQLKRLSALTGIAKSRLIRIWLSETSSQDIDLYLTSTIK